MKNKNDVIKIKDLPYDMLNPPSWEGSEVREEWYTSTNVRGALRKLGFNEKATKGIDIRLLEIWARTAQSGAKLPKMYEDLDMLLYNLSPLYISVYQHKRGGLTAFPFSVSGPAQSDLERSRLSKLGQHKRSGPLTTPHYVSGPAQSDLERSLSAESERDELEPGMRWIAKYLPEAKKGYYGRVSYNSNGTMKVVKAKRK